jgi:hypothetical protein
VSFSLFWLHVQYNRHVFVFVMQDFVGADSSIQNFLKGWLELYIHKNFTSQ